MLQTTCDLDDTARLDTLRVRLPSTSSLRDWREQLRASFAPTKKPYAYVSVEEEGQTSVVKFSVTKSRAGGWAVESHAKTWRSLSAEAQMKGLVQLLGVEHASAARVVRADWVVQLPSTATPVALLALETAGFKFPKDLAHTMTSTDGTTHYREFRWRTRASEGRLLARVYDAVAPSGPVVRVEVQESVGRRKLIGGLAPHPATYRLLAMLGTWRHVRRVPVLAAPSGLNPAQRICRAVGLLQAPELQARADVRLLCSLLSSVYVGGPNVVDEHFGSREWWRSLEANYGSVVAEIFGERASQLPPHWSDQ